MTTAYSYVRFSTPEQAQGDSERRQTQRAEEYCKRHHLTLDTSLKAERGVSAWKGKNKKGTLGRFLDKVKSGEIKSGVLLVESLDRLSRQEPLEAFDTFRSIVNLGITIITLMPEETYSRETIKKNPSQLHTILALSTRANEESNTKSERISAAWNQKRINGKKQLLTSNCPKWLEVVGRETINGRKFKGTFVAIPERVAIVKRIFQMAANGIGAMTIAKTLNQENVSSFGKNGWEFTTIRWMLKGKNVLGEYQPCKMVDGKSIADGEPIKDYYPAIITEKLWYAVQKVLANRSHTITRGPQTNSNLFGKLLVSGEDGASMVFVQKRAGHTSLVSSNVKKGLSNMASFPYTDFEEHFLAWMKEIDIAPMKEENRVDELEGRLAMVKSRKAKTQKAMVDGDFDLLFPVLKQVGEEEKVLMKDIEAERAKHSSPNASPKDIGSLYEKLAAMPQEAREQARERIKSAMASIVQQVRVWTNRSGAIKATCVVQIILTNGTKKLLAIRTERNQETVSLPYMEDAFRMFEINGKAMAEAIIDIPLGDNWDDGCLKAMVDNLVPDEDLLNPI